MLYIKIYPSDRETQCNTSYHKIGVSGAPRPLKRGFGAGGGGRGVKYEFINFEDFLVCYISKLIPVIGKFIATHLSIRLVCQGPLKPLERDLRAPGGPMNCDLSSLKVSWHVTYQY